MSIITVLDSDVCDILAYHNCKGFGHSCMVKTGMVVKICIVNSTAIDAMSMRLEYDM
jgi:hypothetical protein